MFQLVKMGWEHTGENGGFYQVLKLIKWNIYSKIIPESQKTVSNSKGPKEKMTINVLDAIAFRVPPQGQVP